MTNLQEVQPVTEKDEFLYPREDAILALDFVIQNLRKNNVADLASALSDIVQIYNNIYNHVEDNCSAEEYQDMLYMYMVDKYFSKIRLDKYKQKTIEAISEILKKDEQNTVR